jgi:hypothetical protein
MTSTGMTHHTDRHPGESRDPLTRINREALLALMEFNGPRLSPLSDAHIFVDRRCEG